MMLKRSFRNSTSDVLVRFAIYCYPLLLIVAIWEALSKIGSVRPLFLPSVRDTWMQLGALLADNEILLPLGISLFRAFSGLALAIVLGVLLGLLMARNRVVRYIFDPLISFAFPAPKIVFMPIFILWFGIDHLSKILLVVATCIFPLIIATYHGALSVNKTILWSAKAMGTSERRILTHIIFPASMTHIFNGVRITVPMALITAFTAEMVTGGGGVGALLMFAQRFFATPTVFVYIGIMALTGVVLDRLLVFQGRLLMPWLDENS